MRATAIWLLAQPRSPRRLVAVAFAAVAAVGAAHAAAGWSTPVSLSTPIPPSFVTESPAIAINASGAQAAAWINEGNYLLLQVAARDTGGGWSTAQTLTPISGSNAFGPAVAIDPAGNAVAIWGLYDISRGSFIQASARPAHGSWGPVVTLSSASIGPLIGMDSGGNAVAVWGLNGAVLSANLPAGGSWTTPVVISSPGISSTPWSLAVNASGDAVVGWSTSRGQILVTERKSGTWGAPITIAPPAFRANQPHVAINGPGDEAIAWSGRGTTLAATRSAGGTWSSPTTLFTLSLGGTARIALDDAGNAVALFVAQSNAGVSNPVVVVAHPAGGSWGTASNISGANSSAAGLVATPAGSFVAGWLGSSPTGTSVLAAIRSPGQTTFGAPVVVATGAGHELALAAARGNVAATWIGPGPAVQVSDNNTP